MALQKCTQPDWFRHWTFPLNPSPDFCGSRANWDSGDQIRHRKKAEEGEPDEDCPRFLVVGSCKSVGWIAFRSLKNLSIPERFCASFLAIFPARGVLGPFAVFGLLPLRHSFGFTPNSPQRDLFCISTLALGNLGVKSQENLDRKQYNDTIVLWITLPPISEFPKKII